MKKSQDSRIWIAWMFLIPAVSCMLLVVAWPLLTGIWYSLTDIDQYNMGNAFQPATYEFIGLENFKEILFDEDSELFPVMKQTLIWTFVNVFFHFSFGLGLALLLHRKLPGSGVYRVLLMIPWAVPSFISAFSWRWMFNTEYGLFNKLLPIFGLDGINWLSDPFWAMVAVICTNVWLGFPFMMVALLGGLQAIPKGVYEAASIDGAGKLQQFWNITLPLLKPVSFSTTLLGFIWTFNMFPIIYLVTQGGPSGSTEILATYAYREAFEQWNLGGASAWGVIILSILICFSVFYAKTTKYAD